MKSDKTYLLHIIDCARQITGYTNGLTQAEFLNDRKTIDAVIRNFEVIGEATKRLSSSFTEEHSNIAWKQMAGMRDKLIHDYLEVDHQILWNTVTDLLPNLIKEIQLILEELQ